MNILILTSYLSDDTVCVSSNKTGFGYMVNDIASSFARHNHSTTLYSHTFLSSKNVDLNSFTLVGKRLLSFMKFLNLDSLTLAIKMGFVHDKSILSRLKLVYYGLSLGYIRSVIRASNTDIIHIHGVSYEVIPFIYGAVLENEKFAVTLHGLNFLNNEIGFSKSQADNEKRLISFLIRHQVPITVISSGIKQRLLSCFKLNTCDSIHVVTNGSNFFKETKSQGDGMRKHHNIPKDSKVYLCVGSITENKNQIELIKAFSLLPDHIQKESYLVFVGKDTLNGALQSEVARLGGLRDRVIFAGMVSKSSVKEYYAIANYFVTASISEGFGIPIIEAFAYGVPVLCFSDIDPVADIANDKCLVTVASRTTQALSVGMQELFETDWDKEFIAKYSEEFSLESMCDKYISVFSNSPTNKLNASSSLKELFRN